MLASNEQAHSNVGVIVPQAIIAGPATPYPTIQGAENPKKVKEGKHFLIRWKELWTKDAYGMVTFGFAMFCLGLITEWYYFVR